MDNKKKTIIVIAIVVFFVVVILVNLLLPDDNADIDKSPLPTSASDSYFSQDNYQGDLKPATDNIKAGGSIVKNFYTEDKKISPEGDVILSETSNHSIFYFKNDDSFLISIVTSPFQEQRKIAEEDFLRQLEVDEEKACKLHVVTTTPSFANPEEAGINWPLSFCKE